MTPYTLGKIATEVYIVIVIAIIFAQWKKSDKELKAFGIAAFFITLGNLTEMISCLLQGNASTVAVMISIILGTAALPFMSYFLVFRINSEAKRTVLQDTLPKSMTILSIVNIVLTLAAFIFLFWQADKVFISVEHIKSVLYSVEGIGGLILCVAVWTKRRYLPTSTLFILISPIILSVVALVSEFFIPEISIGYIAMSIGIFMQYITLLRRIGSEAEVKELITINLLRTDALTNLMNRRAFSDFLNSHPEESDAGIIFFDVNELKKINDEQGHAEGDKLIVRCSELLNNTLLNTDLYRISGDEFIAIYYGRDNHKYYEKELNEVRSVLKETGSLLSSGAFWGEGMKIVDIIKQAEIHMYDEKKAFYESSGKERRH